MLRTYTLRDLSGETDKQVATSVNQARELSALENAAVIGWVPWTRAVTACAGDCGDCNEARSCATREQAK